ncbi:MAG TPA: ACP phosphodiesterase [Bacteroidia bacterium]
MNFLAHLYLSGNDEQLMIGNFIADSVKGSYYEKFPEGIKKGILLHRAIDFFSDNHPVFLKSVERLRPNYRKYSGVIVDIFYDHFLAKDWKSYSENPLEQFAEEVHLLMMRNIFHMPEKSLMFLKYAMRTNRLVSYANVDGIGEVLYGMSRRTKFKSNMEFAAKDLKENYSEFENEFRIFFEEARGFVAEWRKANFPNQSFL